MKEVKSFVMENGQEVKEGETYCFDQLWDGNGDGKELLESGSIWIGDNKDDMPVIADFTILEEKEDVLETLVKITDLA